MVQETSPTDGPQCDHPDSGQAGFTPGPWRVDGNGAKAIVRGADITVVAVRHRLPGPVHEANAHLIAAAPEMYEALRFFAFEIGIGSNPDYRPEIRLPREEILAARAALAKARGSSS